jgi:hypothetical protein
MRDKPQAELFEEFRLLSLPPRECLTQLKSGDVVSV